MVKDVRLPGRHLAQIPHGAVETTTIGMTHPTLPMNIAIVKKRAF